MKGMTVNQKFQNALNRKEQNCPPIWFMRQAGRYHKHYQALRSKHNFLELCRKPELASEVALGPIEDFDFDVSILFSDILFPLDALGQKLDFTDQGPQLDFYLTKENFNKVKYDSFSVEKLAFQKEAVELTRKKLPHDKSLIGFIGAPWTLFSYAVEGTHKGNLILTKQHIDMFNHYCEMLIPLLIQNIELQLSGGAELVMLFDTCAGEVSPAFYQNHIWPQTKMLIQKYPNKLALYMKGATHYHYSDQIKNAALLGFGYDHRFELSDILKKTQKGFVQGNFDQSLLFLDSKQFEKELMLYLDPIKKLSLSERAGWVCGLGHGVLPKTPEANVKTFIKTVREVLS